MRVGRIAPMVVLPSKENSMNERRVGLWLIGACGGVGTTAVLGLAALRRALTGPTSMVTALPAFAALQLDEADAFIVGGHDVRRSSFVDTAIELHQRSNVFEPALI